jgi:hypothetical protein
MRTLLYVPIIHTSADLGSVAGAVVERGIAALGEEAWMRHRETVYGFWRAIADYFDRLDVTGMNIYQDGMVAEGDLGRRIAEDTAAAGSLNYQLVLRLLDRGASLVKTEDFGLVKQEYDRLVAIIRAESFMSKVVAIAKYRLVKATLLRRRDAVIARRIAETLKRDQTGILFIGALHRVHRWRAPDIQVEEIKDAQKIRDYQQLLPLHASRSRRFNDLGRYLIAQVECGPSQSPIL